MKFEKVLETLQAIKDCSKENPKLTTRECSDKLGLKTIVEKDVYGFVSDILKAVNLDNAIEETKRAIIVEEELEKGLGSITDFFKTLEPLEEEFYQENQVQFDTISKIIAAKDTNLRVESCEHCGNITMVSSVFEGEVIEYHYRKADGHLIEDITTDGDFEVTHVYKLA